MASIFLNTRSPVCVHVLHDRTLTERNRELLSETAETYGQSVAFYDVSPYNINSDSVKLELRCSPGTMFRLLIPEVLPASLEKVIYLDCDVLVNMDIRELWEVPLEGFSLAGVLDRPENRPFKLFSERAFRLRWMRCDRKYYVNGGVLLMNLPRIREKCSLFQRIFSWAKEYGRYATHGDQDMLNSCFRGDIKILDPKFNTCRTYFDSLPEGILHAVCEPKPWEALWGSAAEGLYWHTLLKTPWGRLQPDEIADLLLAIASSPLTVHRKTSQCYKRIFSRLRKDIFCCEPVSTLWLLGREAIYRLGRALAGKTTPARDMPAPAAGDRVLWVRFWAFGDVLEAAADACNFKRRFPEVHLTFLSNPEYTGLLRGMPCFDEVIGGRKKPFAEWWRTLRKIRAGRYKWVVSDHRGGHTSFLALFSGALCRVGTSSLFSMNYHVDTATWFSSLGVDVKDRSLPSVLSRPEWREAVWPLAQKLPERRLLVLIGAGAVKKMWTAEGWIELLRPLLKKGWGIVLNGHGPLEESLGREIENALASENVLNLAGALNFEKMAGLASFCELAVGNDTGPLHLAALSGVPTLGLFSYSTSRDMNLTMPWFREFCAADWVVPKNGEIPLKLLSAKPVAEAFDAFIEEFLPKAWTWRQNPAAR
jgi:lipopolysaccharide biosynthesis glycosyltransferase/ADP-heptose:LPS heptosyltransferase